MLDRLPPNSLEAEQAVLGSILIDQDAIIEIADFLRPEDFYRSGNGLVYKVCLELYEKRIPTDIVMVAEQLEKMGMDLLADMGGASFLASLSNATPSAVHVESYARIVQRTAVLRSLIRAAGQVADIAYRNPDDLSAALDEASQALYQVSDGHTQSAFKDLKQLLHKTYDKIDLLYSNRGQVVGIGSGLDDLDKLTQGFQPSDLIIVAARPSVGKTSLALNIAEHAATREAKVVGMFSLEMSEEQLVLRLLSSASDVDSQRLRSGYLQDDDFPKIAHAMNKLADAPIYIDDTPALTITELRTKARRVKSQVGMDLCIIDYLQLMNAPRVRGKDMNRVQEVSEISQGLKQLARELEVPVIALSQLSRGPEGRDSPEPRLSDLRESGAIEQDADLVLFLWKQKARDEADQHEDGEWVNLKLAKHRNGPTGEVQLWFRKAQTRFYTLDHRFD